jgi:hypothetical protein
MSSPKTRWPTTPTSTPSEHPATPSPSSPATCPGFQNFTGPTQADLLRLNVAVPPSAGPPNRLGLVGGDPAGFPNGRRLEDDVTTIELRAVAGLTYPLVSPGYVPDGAAAAIEDGTFNNPGRVLLSEFPYMGTPYSGYSVGT